MFHCSCSLCVQILQTGQEIMELDTSGFATQGPTVYAGNIGDNKYIIQVSPMGIRLLEGGKGTHQCISNYDQNKEWPVFHLVSFSLCT